MLKAGALLFSLSIAVILALISGSIILYSYYDKLEVQDDLLIQKGNINAVSGINYLMTADGIPLNRKTSVDLFGAGTDVVDMEMNSWGLYTIARAHSKANRFNFFKMVLTGKKVLPEKRVALYLADNNRPLSLAGKTYISGTCYISKAGVKAAYIEGQNFSGTKLINGEINQSAQRISRPDKSLMDAIIRYSLNQTEADSLTYWDESENIITNSFSNSCLVLKSNSKIDLKNSEITGYVKIFSEKEITVSGSCLLKDIILAAPVIRIEEGFKGTIQCMASDTIIIEKDCILKYPSALAVIRNKQDTKNALIKLSPGCVIEGDVFMYDEFESATKAVLLKMEKDSKVYGNIYSSGLADLEGAVFGQVMTSKIVLSTPSSTYENHLLNATIDAGGLSSFFVGGTWQEAGSPEVVKDLY